MGTFIVMVWFKKRKEKEAVCLKTGCWHFQWEICIVKKNKKKTITATLATTDKQFIHIHFSSKKE